MTLWSDAEKDILRESCIEFISAFEAEFLSPEEVSVIFGQEVDPFSGIVSSQITLSLVTSNSVRGVGAYFPFDEASNLGFNLPYFRGWLARECWQSEIEFNKFQAHLDIGKSPFPELNSNNPLQVVSTQRCLELNLIDLASPFFEVVKKFDLPSVLISGTQIAGPSVGMCEAVSQVVNPSIHSRMVDAFSGSGSLGLIAERKGIGSVVSLDLIAEPLLSDSSRVEYVQEDFFRAIPDLQLGDGDVLALDPFYGTGGRVLSELLRKALPSAIVLNGGRSVWKHEQERLRSLLESAGYAVETAGWFGEAIHVARN